MTPADALARGIAQLELADTNEMQDRLLAYMGLLQKWNRTYNLTAIRDPLMMVSHHLMDSLAITPYLGDADSMLRVADAGSGAGLPGIVLALARPNWRLTLAESNQKKVAFLRQAVTELGLKNAEVFAGRVESWRPDERFAVVISRAFADLATFASRCRHLLYPGGWLAAMKGVYPRQELEELPHTENCRVLRIEVPLLDAERHLVLCREPESP